SSRKRVLSELSLPHVVYLKDVGDPTVDQILKRAAVRLTRHLKPELPAAGIEKVTVERNGAGGPTVHVLGIPESAPEHATALARARELWHEPGQSLTHIRM